MRQRLNPSSRCQQFTRTADNGVSFNAALLYIVPFTLGAVVATAVVRGEVSQVLKFTEKESAPLGAPAKKAP